MTTPDSFSQSRLTLVWLISCLAFTFALTGPQQAQSPQAASSAACSVTGVVQSGSLALPGVTVVALNADGSEAGSTSTEPTGAYTLRLPGPGPYDVRASLPAFAPLTLPATCAARVGLHADARVARRCREAVAWHAGAAGVRQRDVQRWPLRPADRLARAAGAAASSSSTSSRAPTPARRRPPSTTVRSRCGLNCSCLPGFRRTRRLKPLRRRARRVSRTTPCCSAGAAAGAASSAKARASAAAAPVVKAVSAVSRAASAPAAPAAAVAAGRAVRSAVPAGSAACAAAAGCKATPTTRSAARCSTRRRIP